MLRLEPIKDISIDLGKPTEFTPPSTAAFVQSLIDEANAAEENYYDTYGLEENRWRESLSPEEKAAYELLEAAEREIEKNYSPRRDDIKSEPAQAYFKASDAKDRFYESHGKHICFCCSYYTKLRDDKTHTAECGKLKKAIRPLCDSCPDFTVGQTPENEAIETKERIYLAAHPQEAEKLRRTRERERAKRISNHLKHGEAELEFLPFVCDLKDNSTSYIEEAYRKHPDLFVDTPYPTFKEFKSAALAYCEPEN